jgi:hypothetical protein
MCGTVQNSLPGSGILVSLKEDVMNMINKMISVARPFHKEAA